MKFKCLKKFVNRVYINFYILYLFINVFVFMWYVMEIFIWFWIFFLLKSVISGIYLLLILCCLCNLIYFLEEIIKIFEVMFYFNLLFCNVLWVIVLNNYIYNLLIKVYVWLNVMLCIGKFMEYLGYCVGYWFSRFFFFWDI